MGLMNSFSEYLNSLIRNHAKSLSQIAQNAEISRTSLYDIIHGKNLPRSSTLGNLCSALELSENSIKKLHKLNQSEKLRTNRKEQSSYLKEKTNLISEVSSKLLAKGHEIVHPKGIEEADLVLRKNSYRIPILVFPTIMDHSTVLGRLLTCMFHLGSKKGYVCTPDIKSIERKTTRLFNSHCIKILSVKSIMREFK